MKIPIDRTAWSRSSQRSNTRYDVSATAYEGIRCRCRRCEASFVFAPERQKISYEFEKKYVWWDPTFCDPCEIEFVALSESARRFQEQWDAGQSALKFSERFLQQWLAVLRAISPFWGSEARRIHVERRLAELTNGAPGN